MRDSKSLLLLLVSLLLVLVSFGLLWTWGYRFYNKNDVAKVETRTVTLDSAAIANNIRDSLQNEYNATLHDLDVQLDSTLANTDSLKNELDIKLSEFYRLRNEIIAILKNRNGGNDFKVAKQKIGELQNKVQDFRDKNADVENENNKLNAVLTQLDNSNNKGGTNAKPAVTGNKPAAERSNTAFQVFSASDLKFLALSVNNDDETETSSAERTNKLTGSFTVMNFNSQLTNAEMLVVILQPNGRVFKTSDWESGTFNTPEGKKVYSYKINFNYSKGEAKRLLFSLKAANLTQGNYTMQVYYNGSMIARMVKTLS
ncbi:MAG: hypothetical protein ABIR78_01165 [Ferruginibacter sp.]